MVKPSNTAAIGAATARSFQEWLAFLDGIGAEKLSHKEVARRIQQTGDASGWWAQHIAVAYEQHIGRRAPGQNCEGDFAVSVSRTLEGSIDETFRRWLALVNGRAEFAVSEISREPETSRSDRWRYWRCGLADGSRISVTIGGKGSDKAVLAVAHERLESAAQAEERRTFWKKFLSNL